MVYLRPRLAILCVLLLPAASCNVIVGLSGLQEVDCQPPCGAGTGGGSGDGGALEVVSVWPGRNHSCAIMADATLRCWGLNDNGQLGDGTTSPHARPAPVMGLTGVTFVALGLSHTCAVTMEGAYCWGGNSRGQLGDSTNNEQHAPVLITALLDPVSKIQAGEEHTCAEMADGTARCWGSNTSGELADGSGMDRPLPVQVMLPSTVKKLSIGGGRHTCAALDTGAVMCWGLNDKQQLGIAAAPMSATPAVVAITGSAQKVYVGYQHSCALLGDGTAQCWGANDWGQLGDGTTNGRAMPEPVMGLSGVASMGGGYRHTCAALSATPTVKCWGANDHGQIGIGGTSPFVLVPTLVADLMVANQSASARGESTCSVAADGDLYCWGWNDDGQLGDGTKLDRSVPTRVLF